MTLFDRLISSLTLLSALGCGLMAGVFFAFSSFVMNALARLPAAQGILAMQSINITVINSLFLTAFSGTAVTCLLLVLVSLTRWGQPGTALLLGGGLLYLLGTVLVTINFNVPLNDAIAAVRADSVEGAKLWANYLVTWTAWNHVRSVASLAAMTSLVMAYCHRGTQ